MLAPLSWLKDYVDITLEPAKLAERLTEVGLGVEKITKKDNDVIFELEITPNRPDLLSIIGIAREIAAIENKKIKYPRLRQDFGGQAKHTKILPLEIKTDHEINPRFTAIIMNNITVKESPGWLKERLLKINQRPINNIVDITNYVMFELGNPIHAFDYDKISGNLMQVDQSKGGEAFKSVDDTSYHLPKDAVIIRDKKNIIDLCGIKGGFNSGTFSETKRILIRIPVENPVLIRKVSQSLGLRSEASSIFERGVNKGGTIDALKRTVDLVSELAGGEVASKLYDLKKSDFLPWNVDLRLSRLNKILGIIIDEKEVRSLLERLNLESKKTKQDILTVTIPTYRNDLKIEEDLIEEVARLYGYNKFPKTLIEGQIPTKTVPYFKDYEIDKKVKNILKASGFSEIYSYSLISEKDLANTNINPENVLRVDNPVSRDFEYLRPTLKINLLKAFSENKSNYKEINLFELGKVYAGKSLDDPKEEYFLSGISSSKNFYVVKGVLERLFEELNVKEDPTDSIEIIEDAVFFELNFSEILKKPINTKMFKPVAKFPSIIEDLSIIVNQEITYVKIVSLIKKESKLVSEVKLLDMYDNKKTFRIKYQDSTKTLTNEEVAKEREKIYHALIKDFDAQIV